MNDLFSTASFKRYTDLKEQVRLDEMETGTSTAGPAHETVNLEKFFEDVENVKEDLKSLEQLHKHLQDLNEETKLAHNANTVKDLRSRMDRDVEQVLRKAKVVKGKLEALDKSNAANRKIPGCGPGSSADRTRTSVVGGLGKKLKDLMDAFQSLRAKMAAEYKETVGRRYFTVTGKQPDDDTVEAMISSGESENFLQKAIEEQGRGQVMDTIMEIQERHDAVKEIEKSLMDLHQVFLDMAALVEAQGHQLNDIESHVAHASSFVRKGTVELETAREYQKSSRKWACLAVLLVIVIIIVALVPLLINLGVIHF
ncbi:syntaxin-124-like [Asparagus officinalis]|uniref:syntaxin-124-like n=1 Tax=Asparagus officinalis TaxID=4686 RepID=UPI00098E423E|nr:syntaxin-124-like [Asparagus officinalis]